jgi:PDZ domain
MSAPRHLWSGDWQDESSALSEELAARRARAAHASEHEPPEPEDGTAVRAPNAREPRPRRLAISPRHLRIALAVGALTLAAVAVAFAVGSALSGGGSNNQPLARNHSRAWLGVDTSTSAGVGVTVDSVEHGSPAAAAGIKPGDVITALDTQPIATPAILLSDIDGMQPGDHVELQLQRGGTVFTADVVLGRRPGRSP